MAYEKGYGAIFNRTNKTNPKEPDATGTFSISPAMLTTMNNCNKTPDGWFVLEFSGWTKQGPKAGNFLSGSVHVANDNSKVFIPRSKSGETTTPPSDQDEIPW